MDRRRKAASLEPCGSGRAKLVDEARHDYGQFLRALEAKQAANTPQEAKANFVAAARDATGVSYDYLFKEGWTVKTGTESGETLTMTNTAGKRVMLGFGGDDTMNGSSAPDHIVGGIGDDTLNGNAGNDTLVASDGNDIIRGGTGKDLMAGGDGADRFVFRTTAEAGIGSGRDTVLDLAAGDKIDLSGIDANTRTGGNQAFKFIGTQGFHKKAGELRWTGSIAEGDVNGDGKPDFQIALPEVLSLDANLFIL